MNTPCEKPNIILITTDYQSGEDGPLLGTPQLRMPGLDRLCRDGVVLERHYSTAPICMPERFTWVSGQYPHTHGKWGNGGGWLPEGTTTFMEQLTQGGYYTLGIGKMHFDPWEKQAGFSRRIIADRKANFKPDSLHNDAYAKHLAKMGLTRWDYLQHCWDSALPHVYDWPFAEEAHIDHFVGSEAKRVLVEHELPDQPWLMWVSFNGPHNPWDPPREDSQPYLDQALPKPRGDLAALRHAPQSLTQNRYGYTKEVADYTDEHPEQAQAYIQTLRAHHYGNLTLIDRQVEGLLDLLEQRGELDDTIIIWTADHGAMLGDFGNFHKALCQERSARVPFVVHCPKRFAPKRSLSLCGGVDLMPTLLSLAGVAIPDACEGNDLTPLLTGEAETIGDNVAFLEITGHVGVVTDTWKYFKHPNGEAELYNLAEDPDELVNRIDDPACAEVVSQLQQKIIANHAPLSEKLAVISPPPCPIRDAHTFRQGERFLPGESDWAADVGSRSQTLRVTLENRDPQSPPPDGAVFVQAEQIPTWPAMPVLNGFALYIKDGQASLGVRLWGKDVHLTCESPLPAGLSTLEVHWDADGTLSLAANQDKPVITAVAGAMPRRAGRVERVAPMMFVGVAHESGNAPLGDYDETSDYPGTIRQVDWRVR